MNDFIDEKTKARLDQAVKQTQVQAEEAAVQLGGLLRVGAKKLKEAADKARDAIQRDIDSRQ